MGQPQGNQMRLQQLLKWSNQTSSRTSKSLRPQRMLRWSLHSTLQNAFSSHWCSGRSSLLSLSIRMTWGVRSSTRPSARLSSRKLWTSWWTIRHSRRRASLSKFWKSTYSSTTEPSNLMASKISKRESFCWFLSITKCSWNRRTMAKRSLTESQWKIGCIIWLPL